MRKFFLPFLFVTLSVFPSFAQTDNIVRVGACATEYYPWNLVVQDSLLYLADRGSFVIVDVSNPTSLQVRDIIENPATDRAKAVATNVFTKDSLAYVRSNSFLTVINTIDPDSLVMIGYTSGLPLWGGIDPRGLFVSDTIAYVANSDHGVIICNVKDPTHPFVIDSFPTYRAINLTMRDSLLFIADFDSLLIVNAKDPLNLFRVSSVSLLEVCEPVYDVAVEGNYAYLTARGFDSGVGKVVIVDISNVENPEVVGEIIGIRGDPVAIYLENGYVHVAAQDWWELPKKKEGKADVEGGVRVGFTDPDSSAVVTSYDTPGSPQDIYVVGDLIFVADYDSVQILRHIGMGVEENEELRITNCELKIYPNPFREKMTISFTISSPTEGALEVYDISGRKVRTLYNGNFFPAKYRFYWNGRDDRDEAVVGGKYFLVLSLKNLLAATKEIIYIK